MPPKQQTDSYYSALRPSDFTTHSELNIFSIVELQFTRGVSEDTRVVQGIPTQNEYGPTALQKAELSDQKKIAIIWERRLPNYCRDPSTQKCLNFKR